MNTSLYFGTYTRGKSEGIYQTQFNQKTGQLSVIKLFAKLQNPTYLTKSVAGNFYAITKVNDMGGLVALNSNGQKINDVLLKDGSLCHLTIDEDRQLVYAANYHKGQITLYKINEDGGLTLIDLVQLQGSGPHPNQKSAHAHYVGITPDKYLVTCDLGTDSVTTYDITSDYKLKQIANYQATPGAGARHLVFHPKEKIAYLLGELNARIEVLIYNGLGQFEKLQSLSTLPTDYIDFNATAAIRISADGKHLYASNRGHNSIAVYSIRKDAQLDLLEIVPSYGDTPRDFILTKNQNYLIIPHQESDNATVYKRNLHTGHLELMSKDFYIPESVCVFED